MNQAYPRNLQGLCIGVLSGDRILFQGPPDRENGGYRQKILHLAGIQAPRVDPVNPTKDQKYGYASRQFMRKMLVGKRLKFTVQKKVNEIQIGFVFNQENEDTTRLLLKEGFAKLRSQKIQTQNADDYQDAEQQARMAEVGIWNQQTNDKNAYRNIKQISDADFIAKYGSQVLQGIAEQIFASKSTIYIPKQSLLITLNYSDVQVIIISQKTNGQSKNNAKSVRSLLQSDFLQRQVKVHLSSAKSDSLTGYLTTVNHKQDSQLDIRKVLLQNGHAKLAKQAISTLPTKQFIELKNVAHAAMEDGKGFWKQQKITKSETINDKEYSANVYQVHSGDSISVYNPIKKQIVRIFFPNVRAPSSGKPYSYQSKQALRKKCIGKQVQVHVQFSKKISVKKFEGDVGELKNFTFATVFLGGTNLSVYMLDLGLINIQQIRTEQNITRFLQQLKNAEQSSKKAHKNLHSNSNIKIPTFNDVSGGKNKKIDAGKSKQLFQFLKDEQYLTGTVQLVLNGSRFKVRFHQQHVMAIVVLDGVRCLPNQEIYSKISEQSLKFSKLNALQRDFQIKLKRVDQKGVYQGVLILQNSTKDYALDLLQNGLAVTVSRNKNALYEDIEADSRKKKIGLWKFDLNIQAIKGGEVQKQFKPVNFIKNLVLVEVASAQEFYLQNQGCKKPQISQKPVPATLVKTGELYSVRFSVDQTYYRGKVLKESKNNSYLIFFIDYGNYQVVNKQFIGVLEDNLKKLKSPLYHCSLYGLSGFTKQAENMLKDCTNAKIKVEMKEQAEDGQYKVILYDIANKNKNINLELLQFGEAENNTNIQAWEKAEEKARMGREGKWNDE